MENTQNNGAVAQVYVRHTGGCHCGAVRFEAELEAGFKGSRCNCRICQKLAPTGVMLKPAGLHLLAGDESLNAYEWGAHVSTRYFCKHCGVYCFGKGNIPELGGHFASVNLNCLDDFDPNTLEILHWDGRHDNWEAGPRSTPWPVFPQPEEPQAALLHPELAQAS